MKNITMAPAVFCLLVLAAPEADAGSPAIVSFTTTETFPPSPVLADSDSTVGWSFVPNGPVAATAFGFYDAGQDGLREPHLVGIWNEAQELLASAVVPAGQGASLTGDYRYVSIPALALEAGRTYVIGATVPLGVFLEPTENPLDPDMYPFYDIESTSLVLDSRLALSSESLGYWGSAGDHGSSGPGTLHFPQEIVEDGYFFAANFMLVPEPSSLVVAAILLTAHAMRRKAATS